jgi:cardiolipin synthase
VAAGLTDALDGLLARLLKQRTVLGQYLDPVADKLLLSTLFLVLMHKGLIPARVTVLVFGRDVGILVVAAILYAATGRREFSPSIFGKANTLAQVSRRGCRAAASAHPARWVAGLLSQEWRSTPPWC